MDGMRGNYTLKDEITAYWSARAATFDDSPGHGMRTRAERDAWAELFRAHLPAQHTEILELASGTGEVTRVLLAMGCTVTAIDIAEPMILRARAKHADANGRVKFLLADAENTMLPAGRFDAVLCRHLAWTLTDPERAFRVWLRVLRDGGRVVIVDGDWVTMSVAARLRRRLVALWDRLDGTTRLWDQAAHQAIMARLPFCDGLRAERLMTMLAAAGFTDIRRGSLAAPYRAQNRSATLKERLSIGSWRGHSYIVSAARAAG